MRKIILASLVLLLAFALSASSESSPANFSAESRCAIPKFEKAFEQAQAVFVGRVLSEKTEGRMKVFELEVEKYWKGVESKKITVNVYENPRYEAPFKVGKSFLIFAEADDDGKLFDRRCSRTKPLTEEDGIGNLKEDLQKLGKAKTCISLGKEENN